MRPSTSVHRSSRKVTYHGRVVYDRPKHLFTESDVRRILPRVVEQAKDSGEVFNLLVWIQKYMLSMALSTIGLAGQTDQVYDYIRDTLKYVLGLAGISTEQKSRFKEVLDSMSEDVHKLNYLNLQ